MKNKKILYAASTYGHIRNFHLDYIEALRAEGHTVLVMARGSEADFNIPFEKKIFSEQNKSCRKKISEILDKEKFDLLILNTSLAAYHVRRAVPKGYRAKVINIVHGYLFSPDVNAAKRLALFSAEWLLRGRTSTVITMNSYDLRVAEKYRLAYSVKSSDGMGFLLRDTLTDPDNLRREFFSANSYVMTFVGELSERKNQRFLISALSELRKYIPNAVLCLVGEGGEHTSLLAYAEELGLSESVIFTGQRQDACDFIRACDLYVSASLVEGMPHNVLEALSLGKTVLLSAVKGHTDLITNGVNGFLYEFGNIDDFVNKTRQIHANCTLNTQIIIDSSKKFSRAVAFPKMLKLIKEDI